MPAYIPSDKPNKSSTYTCCLWDGCLTKRIFSISGYKKYSNVAAIGIGAMVVFIAMVLVAGIAASILIQTSMRLETQAISTGEDTSAEVATGIAVFNIEGKVSGGSIDRLAIMVRSRSGSSYVDLGNALIEISDGTNKYVLKYLNTAFRSGAVASGVFSTGAFTLTADDFGVIEIEDEDNSCDATTPVINRGDKVFLTINTTTTFASASGISERTEIWGRVIPEEGAAGVISFTAPAYFTEHIYNLQ